jgi:hypothetical protein
MKIEVKSSDNVIRVLSPDEVFVSMCCELMNYLEGREGLTVEDRKAAVELVKNFERHFYYKEEKTKTFVFEVNVSFRNLRSIFNKAVKSKIMLQIRKVVPTIIKEVLIKLIVEVILSLIHDKKGETDYNNNIVMA